jgi:hypothetical protein
VIVRVGRAWLVVLSLVFLSTIGAAAIRISRPLPLPPPFFSIPTYPPVALLQSLMDDEPAPPPVVKNPWAVSVLSEESIKIARQVNRCFYYVSGRPAMVTAFSDGRHREGSAHYKLRGVDFRLLHLTEGEVVRVSDCAEVLLGQRYYVKVERRPLHLHAALREDE